MYLRVRRFSKQAEFLHPTPSQNREKLGSGFKHLLAKECEVDRLPFEDSHFAVFIPSIIHMVELNLLAAHLCRNIWSQCSWAEKNRAQQFEISEKWELWVRLVSLSNMHHCYQISFSVVSLFSRPLFYLWEQGFFWFANDYVVDDDCLVESSFNYEKFWNAKALDNL